MNRHVFTFLIIILLGAATAGAYNLRQSSNVDGLQNSAILSMRVDDDGLLWIGTCDGVSISDGLGIVSFPDMYPGLSLSGSLIENILHAPGGVSWIQTNHGLDRFVRSDWSMTSFPQYKGNELICARDNGDLFLLSPAGGVYSFVAGRDADFQHVFNLPGSFDDVLAVKAFGDSLIVVDNKAVTAYTLKYDDATSRYSEVVSDVVLSRPLIFAAANRHEMWAVTDTRMLGRITRDGKFMPVMDISAQMQSHGDISDIITDRNGNIFLAFSTHGVVRIHKNHKGDLVTEDLDPSVGVFCLERSDSQNVVWIGSDCRGVYTISESDYSINSFVFSDLDKIIQHPIRAVYLDRDSTLWLGTKGSGILCIDNFRENESSRRLPGKRLLTEANTTLHDNSVFAFAKGHGNRLWIATEEGVNYCNLSDKTIRRIPQHQLLRYIYDIYEPDDTTLLMATLGYGVIKARIAGTPAVPELTDLRQYVIDGGERASNYFFSISDILDRGIILSNRGQGIFKLEQDTLVPIPYTSTYGSKSVYDVFSTVGDGNTLWLGTGSGLVRMPKNGEDRLYSDADGFISNTIHDILKDRNGDLWISTNRGLVRFRPATEELQTYTRSTGLKVSEFSDGAAFATDHSMIFGGVDGFVVVSHSDLTGTDAPVNGYTPAIRIQNLNIRGEKANLARHISVRDGVPSLTLSSHQNLFDVTFCAPDFIDAANYTYYYSLDDKDGWINNGSNRTIAFTELGYGKYNLAVKYVNRTTGAESDPYVLRITIDAPWYLSTFAIACYVLIVVAGVAVAVVYLMRRQKRRQHDELKLMEYTHKEEVYEEKLRFFTNITHEFSTPLTLIYGPCERILTYAGTDDYIKRYVKLIRINAERLNNLIQELIDFRRMETGHKVLKIHTIDISGLCRDTLMAYDELAETHNIDLQYNIPDEINWNSDFGSLRKVLNNLISNAFKYTPAGGKIELEVKIEDGHLVISVYNTGKGIAEEDKERIFNRYSVLDNVEENAVKGLNRNGLGLAICHSIVETLKGTITIDSVVDKYARFIVTLPPMAKTQSKEPAVQSQTEVAMVNDRPTEADGSMPGPVAPAPVESSDGRRTILLIDDNEEILSLLTDSLNRKYNILTASSADEGIDLLTRKQPDLIITDVMMPGTDGFELTRQIKSNIHTRYIPLVILSAKISVKERVDGLESGADVYIGKPFNLSYLMAVIKRLLEGREHLREYYNSSASAYRYNDGRLLDRENQDVMEKVTAYIDKHIDDEKLSPETLADYLQISLRNLYRKFKDLDLPAPNDFIKNQRMAVAAKMLLTTSDTVQEIMYRTGFTNRSHFYKEFGRRYGMTPGDYRTQNKKVDNTFSDK